MKKTKKILSFVLSIAMICTMFTAFGLTANAAGNEIHVTNYEELRAAVHDGGDGSTGRTIIIDNDITNIDGLRFAMPTGSEITIKSKDPANPATINANDFYICASGFDKAQWGGRVNIENINITADWGFWVYSGANISMKNVTITLTQPNPEAYTTYMAFAVSYTDTHDNNIPSTVTLENCKINPSSIGSSYTGIAILSNTNFTMKDSTVLAGTNNSTQTGFNIPGNAMDINNADANVTITNSSLEAGSCESNTGAAAIGINIQNGNLTLNNTTVTGGTSKSNDGWAIMNYNGEIEVNGGEIIPGGDVSFSNVYYSIGVYNTTNTGSVKVNPVLTFVDNKTVKMSPAIPSTVINFDDGITATVGKDGLAKRDTPASLGCYVSTTNETITAYNGFPTQISAVKSADPFSTDNTPVTANAKIPAPTYTVTIPASVDFGNQTQALEKYRNEAKDQFGKAVVVSKDFAVSAKGVANLFNDLDDGKADYINITASFDSTLKGTSSTSNTVPYTINQNSTAIATGDIIATFYNDVDLASKGKTNSATATITMNRADIKNADSYTGTMTFTIAVADR